MDKHTIEIVLKIIEKQEQVENLIAELNGTDMSLNLSYYLGYSEGLNKAMQIIKNETR